MEGVNAILNYAYGVYSILGISMYVFIIMMLSVVCGISKSYKLDVFCKIYTKVSIVVSIIFVVVVSIVNTVMFLFE